MKKDAHPALALARRGAMHALSARRWIISKPGRSLTAKYRPNGTSPLLIERDLAVDLQFWMKDPYEELTFEFAGDFSRKDERAELAENFRSWLAGLPQTEGFEISGGSTPCKFLVDATTKPDEVAHFITTVGKALEEWCRVALPEIGKKRKVYRGPGLFHGLTDENVRSAIQKYDEGVEHAFGPSTGYDLVYRHRRYPPKAILGLAATALGHNLGSNDFNSGASAFKVLRSLGFTVERKSEGELYPDEANASEHTEGAVVRVVVNRFERDREARAKCVDHHKPICQVCETDFGQRFGEIGAGFIHVHHLVPLSQIRKGYVVDPINDLRPVCPNCHAMLHRRKVPFSIDEMREILSERTGRCGGR